MQTIEHIIINPTGMHARPASIVVKTASKFQSTIIIKANGKEVLGKGIIGIMTLGLKQGDKMIVDILGPDEEEAAKAIQEILP